MTAGVAAPLRRALAGRSDLRLALGLLAVLLAVNIALAPGRFAPSGWGTLLGLAAPLILASVAVMVPILAGRGSIDVSVGPLMGLINVVVIDVLITGHGLTSPWVVVPFALAMGLASGALNGALASLLRIQPIVATLGTYLIYSGLALVVLPSPAGEAPTWLRALSGGWAVLPLAAAAALWLAFKRLPAYEQLMATGGDDRAAYTAGVDVPLVRLMAYALGGIFAAMAAIALTALIGSGDPAIGPNYTLIAIASAALGGVSLSGGVGGFAAAAIGAADLFLLQNLLTQFNISTFVLQLAYGAILVLAVSLNSDVLKRRLAAVARR